MFRKKLREGELDDKEIDIDLEQVSVGVEIMAPPGMEEMTSQLQNMFSNLNQGKRDQQRLTIREAYRRGGTKKPPSWLTKTKSAAPPSMQ